MNPELLRHIAVLKAMDEAALARLAGVLEARDHADGESVFREGDPADGMYFIASGAVRVEKRTQAAGGPGAKTLAILEPGDYFGEMALLDRQPRSASAVASGPTRTLRLSTEAFSLLHGGAGHAGLSVLFAMIRTCGDRIRRLSAQVVVYDEVGKAIGEARDLDQLLAVVLRQLGGALEADRGLVLLRGQFSDRLESRATLNLALTPAQQQDVAAGRGLLARLGAESGGHVVRDFGSDALFADCPKLGFETPALLWAPIRLGDQSLGLILLGGQQPGQFDLNHLQLVLGVARQTAQAIVNARHREEEQARARHGRQFVRF